MPRSWTARFSPFTLCVSLAVWLAGCESCRDQPRVTGAGAGDAPAGCSGPATDSADGLRRVALLVGVGKYRSPRIRTLTGPPGDVERMKALLTGPYGFPPGNVCVLLDDAATLEGVRSALDRALVERVRPGKGDVAVLYFSGHGAFTRDAEPERDEADGFDETLVLADSRTEGPKGFVPDLVDDELNRYLAKLYAVTENVTLVTDSCNSETVVRGDSPLVSRAAEEMVPPGAARGGGFDVGDGDFERPRLPNLVALAAASDGTSAYERGGRGIFTDAILQVLSSPGASPPSWEQAALQIRPIVRGRSTQVPSFHGSAAALARPAFGAAAGIRPLGLRVASVGEVVALEGAPLPGMSVGAELRVYDGSVSGADARDGKKAKAMLVVTDDSNALAPRAKVSGPVRGELKVGDLAIPLRPGDAALRLMVRLRTGGPGALTAERASAVRAAIQDDRDAASTVVIPADPAAAVDFELSSAPDGVLLLRDHLDRVRNHYRTGSGQATAVARNLWQHARQKALLALRGDVGAEFEDEASLELAIVARPEAEQPCKPPRLVPAPRGEVQPVPICTRYFVRATNRSRSPLVVAALAFWSDGGIDAFVDPVKEPIPPGEARDLPGILATAPVDVEDTVVVFGSKREQPVPWELLVTSVDEAARSADDPTSAARGGSGGLYRALSRYLQPGERGGKADAAAAEEGTWTRSTVRVLVKANAGFAERGPEDAEPGAREYTIEGFDVRPYLPDRQGSALRAVLLEGDRLAKLASSTAAVQGVGYKQHDWSEPTFEANLKKGIDCSRFVHAVFTRAGLRYNGQNEYLPTARMVGSDTPMKQEFVACEAPYRTGDVLVYRDDGRGDGHTVLVVDPVQRIAVGSHGWDGSSPQKRTYDVGVEYQKIKNKADWQRWDRATMDLKACWRHRKFVEEAGLSAGGGLSGACKTCGGT